MTFRIAITGATGFIGSAILEEFLRAEAEIIVLLREESDCQRIVGKTGFETLTYYSLRDENIIEDVSAFQPSVFIHCAWRGVGGHERNEDFQILDNIPLTLDTITLAKNAGCKQWIGLGSQAEYGNQNTVLDERAPLLPTTIYGRAKLSAGIAALALCNAYGLTGTWMRVFSTYGPGDAPSWFIPYVINEFLENRTPRLTRCEQRWDYLHVSDAARAVVAVASKLSGGIYNLGSGIALPLKEYIELIRIGVGSNLLPEYGAIPYRSDQVMHLQADIRKLVREVGWRPIISFSQGIKEVIEHEVRLRDIKSAGAE